MNRNSSSVSAGVQKREWAWHLKNIAVNNSIQEEIKSRLKLGNTCYYSVQIFLSFSLLSKKLKIKIY